MLILLLISNVYLFMWVTSIILFYIMQKGIKF